MNKVLELRNRLGMTQDAFAEKCGIARISIARYEAGDNLSRASAEKIARACNVSVSYVLGDTIDTRPPTEKPPEAMTVEDYAATGAAVRVTHRPQPQPSASLDAIIDQLSRLRDTAAPLKTDEQTLIEMYRKLPKEAQAAITRFARSFIKDGDL